MFDNSNNENALIINFNLLGVVISYVMLAMSLYLMDVPLSTKGYWGIGIFLLTLSLVNFVKYRFDARLKDDRLQRLEDAKNEKILEDFVTDKAA